MKCSYCPVQAALTYMINVYYIYIMFEVPKSVLIDYIYIYPACTHADEVKPVKALMLLLANRKVKRSDIIDVFCLDVPVSRSRDAALLVLYIYARYLDNIHDSLCVQLYTV